MNNKRTLLTIAAGAGACAALYFFAKKLFFTSATVSQSSSISKNKLKMGSTFKSNKELVDYLKENNAIHSDLLYKAMLAVDRTFYCRPHEKIDEKLAKQLNPYQDSAQPLPFNATISAPHVHAMCLNSVAFTIDRYPGPFKILDVGSGSAYVTMVIAHMLQISGKRGKVIGIEHIDDLVKLGVENCNLDANSKHFLSGDNKEVSVEFVCGDGMKGIQSEAPFHLIHVGASAKQLPEELASQLVTKTGILIVPVAFDPDSPFQTLVAVSKNEQSKLQTQAIGQVRFVPLGSKEAQLSSAGNYTVLKTIKNDKTGETKTVLPFLMNSEPIDLKKQKWTTAEDL